MIEIHDFTHKGIKYTLKEPLKLYVDGNSAYNDDLAIQVVIYSAIEGQVEQFAKQQLADLWEAYVCCREEELSKNALAFKRKLLGMVL